MTEIETITDWDDEDVLDVIPIIEKSFQVRFKKDAFMYIQTVGDLVQIVESYINYPHNESCTSQSVFYRVRDSIAHSQSIDTQNIFPDSALDELFPLANRRKQVKALKRSLGVNADLLSPPDWLYFTNIIGLILALISLFFIGIAGFAVITFFIISMVVSKKLGKNLAVHTVRELVEKVSSEHYMAVRSQAGTVNRNEILETVINILSSRMGVDKKYINAETRFSWADLVQE
jgi:acyl carrier protein